MAAAEPVLRAMGQRIIHCGPAGKCKTSLELYVCSNLCDTTQNHAVPRYKHQFTSNLHRHGNAVAICIAEQFGKQSAVTFNSSHMKQQSHLRAVTSNSIRWAIIHWCSPACALVAGTGQAAKICNNLVLAISMAAVSEGLALGKDLGLDPKVLTEVFNTSSARCWSSDTYNPVPVRRAEGLLLFSMMHLGISPTFAQ